MDTTLTDSHSPSVNPDITTPCIGVCSTGIGDNVCRGCKRFMHEVVHWNTYETSEKRCVFDRLEALLDQVISDKLDVVDAQKLLVFMRSQGLNYRQYSRPRCWVFQVLKAGATQISDWRHYGVQLREAQRGQSAVQLRDEIDATFYRLSCAHYNRYFEVENVVDS